MNFRSFVYMRARTLRLSGYVRNLRDGQSLEVVAEGPRADLEQLLEYVREGPRTASVEAVDVRWDEPSGGYQDFGIM